jgi:cytochrome c2
MKRLLVLVLFLTFACKRAETVQALAEPAGNLERGSQLAAQYGCTICHTIPGVEGPQGTLAPTLQGVASRPTISFGAVQNTPSNLLRFIQNPASLNPQSSMPPIAMPPGDAQDLAAFVGTLR